MVNFYYALRSLSISTPFSVVPPEIDTLEFIIGDVWFDVPAGVAGRYLDKIKVKSHQHSPAPPATSTQPGKSLLPRRSDLGR